MKKKGCYCWKMGPPSERFTKMTHNNNNNENDRKETGLFWKLTYRCRSTKTLINSNIKLIILLSTKGSQTFTTWDWSIARETHSLGMQQPKEIFEPITHFIMKLLSSLPEQLKDIPDFLQKIRRVKGIDSRDIINYMYKKHNISKYRKY